MRKTLTSEQVQHITAIARNDAFTSIRESGGSTEAPDGGWDSWAINGIGSEGLHRELLPGVEVDTDSELWDAALVLYDRACRQAAAEAETEAETA